MQDIDLTIVDIENIFRDRQPGVIVNHRYYSVLVPLVDIGGELNLLFEVRSLTLNRQPGEVCFPGGRMEKGESAEECAVRETVEELGVDPGAIRIIKRFDSILTDNNSMLYSFLGEIDHDKLTEAKINAREVESVFYVPLSEFIKDERFIASEAPVYKCNDNIIWGLTARLTRSLAKILKASAL